MPKAKRRKSGARKSGAFYFDELAADRAVDFFSKYLRHVKGRWAGKPLRPEPWQEHEIIRPLFGWKRRDGTRRYRTAYIEIPKKNGKSTIAAGIALYLLYADEEPGAEVYSAAVDKEQAAIVFEAAKSMVLASPALLKRGRPLKKSIVVYTSNSSYKVLSGKVETKHGFNPHGIIFDELHAQPNRELWDTLTTGDIARLQPLTFVITTAGYDRHSICWEQHEYARRVKKGIIKDDSWLVVMYAAGERDDWRRPKTWRKANPNLGITISEEFLAEKARKAEAVPAFENTFRRLYLNQWTAQKSRWLSMDAWDRSEGEVDPIELEGEPCYVALDLSSVIDISALVLIFQQEEDFKILPYFWIPEEGMRDRENRDKVPYSLWVKQKLICATPGNVIDYRAILAQLAEVKDRFEVKEVAYDRWGATKIVQDIQEMGLKVVPFGQGFAQMSGASKEFLRLLLEKRLHHGGNPILRWMADNVVVRSDPAGNIKPDKGRSFQRIDGIVASIMGLDRALRNEGSAGSSIYNERGLATV